jgi:hypothetical protein
MLLGMQFNRFTVCAILAMPVLLSIGALVNVPLSPLATEINSLARPRS